MSEPAAPAPLRKTGHDKARAAARRKRVAAEAQGLDDDFVAALVERFYGRIRADAVLGPIFTGRITDWPVHLARMNRFWRAILHGSGEYSGNPMQAHMALPGLETAHFVQWLGLFYATLREVGAERALAPAAQALVAQRARMIADSLLTGIATRAQGLRGARAGADLPVFSA
ncbi:group III truncated hemoglobin [Novosphingobium piscinae]|uniref:Group III truncated hemoglobin n=1 Tax=Novosphingobium piscinae TaxID=1507448 RepID=A0A7X1FZX8_9SPHN|nr:group III truncated hemoglobin [Novosphingobium piscinae]MBC2669939.1 group III truncated hemoglobin [Novosphingobium piscinae]